MEDENFGWFRQIEVVVKDEDWDNKTETFHLCAKCSSLVKDQDVHMQICGSHD